MRARRYQSIVAMLIAGCAGVHNPPRDAHDFALQDVVIGELHHEPGAASWLRVSPGLSAVARSYAEALAKGWSTATINLALRDRIAFALAGTASAQLTVATFVDPKHIDLDPMLNGTRFEIAGVGVARSGKNAAGAGPVVVVIVSACNAAAARDTRRGGHAVWPDWCVGDAQRVTGMP
jgi:hypothetical protein